MTTESISSLKQTIKDLETRLEIALLSANQVWWEWDLIAGDLKTHAVKDCILGYDLKSINHHEDFWFNALPPEELDEARRTLQEHFDGKTQMWEMEHRYRDPQGEYKWVFEAGKVTHRDADGRAIRMVGITQRTHEKKLKDDELKQKNADLTEALKLKDIVLSSASHDIKNALNSASLSAEFLLISAPEFTNQITLIRDSLKQSVSLVSSIHEFAKGKLKPMEIEETDIRQLILECRDFNASGAEQKKLDLRAECKEAHVVKTGGRALRRILDNLVGNAIKFTDEGFVSIVDHSSDGKIIIEIKDSGSGVPEEDQHLLFTPFTKLSSNRDGSGLGLSICNDLVQQLGGEITYQSNSPSGSIFTVRI